MYLFSVIPFLAYWLTCYICKFFEKIPTEDIGKNYNTISKSKVLINVISITASTILGNCLLLFFCGTANHP